MGLESLARSEKRAHLLRPVVRRGVASVYGDSTVAIIVRQLNDLTPDEHTGGTNDQSICRLSFGGGGGGQLVDCDTRAPFQRRELEGNSLHR